MIKEINIQDVSHMYYVYQFSNIATYTKMVCMWMAKIALLLYLCGIQMSSQRQ